MRLPDGKPVGGRSVPASGYAKMIPVALPAFDDRPAVQNGKGGAVRAAQPGSLDRSSL